MKETTATYTVGEMATRIARTGSPDEIATIIRQLRHWTLLGLISPTGEKHEGTGRHRLYGYLELMKAALLETLTRNFKIGVTGLQSFVKVYESQGEFFPSVLLTEAMTQERYLIWIGFRDGKSGQFGAGTAPNIVDAMKDHEVMAVMDASPIAKRIFA